VSGGAASDDVRFFTMCDARYFCGAVALVNSLRIVGHRDPITVLDLGLTSEQRSILDRECDLVEIDRDPGEHPFTFQAYPAVLDGRGIGVIVDSDVIVTQRLDALVATAKDGTIAAFGDRIDRCEEAWSALFGLDAPLVPGLRYLNTGVVAFDAAAHRPFMTRWWQLCRDMHFEPGRSATDPLAYADQDAFNALLMSDDVGLRGPDPASAMVIGAANLAETRVTDLDRLVCDHDGRPVAALHSVSSPKPWTRDARLSMRRNAYVTCLRRCLSGPGLALSLDDTQLPSWLGRSRRAAVELRAMQYAYSMRASVYRGRTRLLEVARRRAAR